MNNSSTRMNKQDEKIKSFFDLDNKLILDLRFTTSCDYHRIVLPFSYLKANPKVPVYMFNRTSSYGLDFLYKLKKQGVKIIMDIDDHYQIDPTHYLYDIFNKNGNTQHLISNIKIADFITTTTPLLASKLKHLNPNILVIPNALPFDNEQFTLSQNKVSKSPIVWAGGASHYHDLKEIKGITNQKLATFVGINQSPEWNKIKLDHPYSKYENELSLHSYMNAYDGHQISIAPLKNSMFNSCKSNLKILEAGAKGLPIICSKVEPYYNSIDKEFVSYANNKTEWNIEINKLLVDKNYREDKGLNLAEHVRLQYNLMDANILRKQLIESFH